MYSDSSDTDTDTKSEIARRIVEKHRGKKGAKLQQWQEAHAIISRLSSYIFKPNALGLRIYLGSSALPQGLVYFLRNRRIDLATEVLDTAQSAIHDNRLKQGLDMVLEMTLYQYHDEIVFYGWTENDVKNIQFVLSRMTPKFGRNLILELLAKKDQTETETLRMMTRQAVKAGLKLGIITKQDYKTQ